jgi:ribose transport system substrate-binding protein
MRVRIQSAMVASAAVALTVGLAACGSSSSGSSGSGSSKSSTASASTNGNLPSWCGKKKITLAVADGFAANNWRRITTAEAQDELKKCPSVTKFIHTDGQGDTQKSISDIEGLAAQGVNAIVIYPDAGKALLPVLTKVTKAGVTTVPYWGDIGGQKGVNYTDSLFIDWRKTGQDWARWIVKAIHGKGNWLYIGGTADNTQNLQRREGMMQVFKKYPNIHQIGPQPYAITNWDPAQHQKQLAAALARYPKIDAITADFGGAMASSLVAFDQAHRKIPAIASEDNNKLGCAAVDKKFPLFTTSTGNWIIRDAIHLAVAHATGGQVPAPQDAVEVPFEDSITGKPHKPECDRSLSGDANLSSHLTHAQLKAAIK